MRVLQLTSDWKWTGPAEPMLKLGQGLRARGHEVWLACPEAPEADARSVAGEARLQGMAPSVRVSRGRGARLWGDRADVVRLAGFIEAEGVDVVHAWHTRDHVMALRAARAAKRTRVAVVRSYRNAEAIPRKPWNRWLFGPRTDGVLCVSPKTAAWNAELRQGRPIRGAFGAVDVARFAPSDDAEARAKTRASLGFGEDDRVVGIVARVQPHRRFDLLLEAARRTFEVDPAARLLVVGRGTRRRELAEEPARRLGIQDRVVFAGYRHADYRAVLGAMDLFTFLVPGSDGTCRALLEAAACGIPAVASERGALPEIVADRETGLVVPEDPGALSRAWCELLGDDERRARMGRAARARAEWLFAPERWADEVMELYAEAQVAAASREPR